jgi:hypothetical protein
VSLPQPVDFQAQSAIFAQYRQIKRIQADDSKYPERDLQ